MSNIPLAISCVALTAIGAGSEPHPRVSAYLPFFCDYLPYAETIWQDAGDGGCWGDGRSGGNGGIRGTSNLTLAYAMLVYAEDHGWLAKAKVDRDACSERVRRSWRYLARSHHTGGGACAADGKPWGRSWQSSLWVGASGLAALLVWEDLDDDTRAMVRRVVVDEADRKIGVRPRNATPGNTAAEENGWDTHAPAIALALFPTHANSAKWLRAAQVLAANTYSVPSDATSEARIGDERVRDVVTTANLFDDFTLDNHGFFHPSYLKVSGQELGEALAMLILGDRVHGTSLTDEFRPYALHHVRETWEVMRRLLLPEGEYAYPSGSDWAIHLPSHQSYYAFVATALRDPVAALAEERGLTCAHLRKGASPGGRFLGATNFEWWWEPIVLKRFALAMLHLTQDPPPRPAPDGALRGDMGTWLSKATRVLIHRTPRYFASVSMRRRPLGLVIPLGPRHLAHPFTLTPRVGSVLPAGKIKSYECYDHELGTALVMRYTNRVAAAMIALRNTVIWIANEALSPVGIQNDNVVTGRGRTIRWAAGSQHVPPLKPMAPFSTAGTWLNIDDELGLLTEKGFEYRPAGRYTRRSAAEDVVTCVRSPHGAGLVFAPRCTASETADLAESFACTRQGGQHVVRCRDGVAGPMVEVAVSLGAGVRLVSPVEVSVDGSAHANHPMANMTDDDPSTFTVIRNAVGKGPTPDAPVAVELSLPAGGTAPHALRIVPRPNYGPRTAILQSRQEGAWQNLRTVHLRAAPVDFALAAARPAQRLRLLITASWDRGAALASAPRNTQIAELALVFVREESPDAAKVEPFRLRVLAR